MDKTNGQFSFERSYLSTLSNIIIYCTLYYINQQSSKDEQYLALNKLNYFFTEINKLLSDTDPMQICCNLEIKNLNDVISRFHILLI